MNVKHGILFAVMLSSIGCSKTESAKDTKAASTQANEAKKEQKEQTTNIVSVDETSKLITEKKAVAVDANNTETRSKFGVIPGAILLSNSGQYETKELPSDKDTNLIFYCGGKACSASDKAADRASQAGYKNVKVMRDGIKGWKDAGRSTEMPKTS